MTSWPASACSYRLSSGLDCPSTVTVDFRSADLLKRVANATGSGGQGAWKGPWGCTSHKRPQAAFCRRIGNGKEGADRIGSARALGTGDCRRIERTRSTLDAILCAWIGARYIEGAARAFGDSDAAIWCPGH